MIAPPAPSPTWVDDLRTHGLLLGVLLALALFLPHVQDYREYVVHWGLTLEGEDPWQDLGSNRTNTYGPLHALLALPFGVHPLLPRVLTLAAFLLAVRWTVGAGPHRSVALALTLYNPLFWFSAAVIGHNDVLVAFLLVASLKVRDGRPGWAGAGVALAGLLKIYPLLVLPFLMTDRGRIEWWVLWGAAITGLMGLLASALVWGAAPLSALGFATDRPSTFLSIFRVFRADWFVASWPALQATEGGLHPGLDQWSMPLLAGGLALLGLSHWLRRWCAAEGVAAALLYTFMVYKVGHAQFWVPTLLILVFAWGRMEGSGRGRLLGLMATYALWLTGVVLWDHVYSGILQLGYPHRDWVGLPTFALQLILLGSWVGAMDTGGRAGTFLPQPSASTSTRVS